MNPPQTNLQPGMTGTAVKQLQDYLVANGYMSQADVSTGYGTYGPKTTAAVTAMQNKLGVNNSSGPGYYGPQTIAAVTKTPTSNNPSATDIQKQIADKQAMVKQLQNQIKMQNPDGTPNGTIISGITVTPTGNSNLDTILKGITDLANTLVSKGYSIPAQLQITPALTQQFLDMAHKAVDPYTQQLLSGEISNVNADLANQQKQYELSAGQTVQDFGTKLAEQDNLAGAAGTALSGQRQINNNNLVNTTNRTLGALQSSASHNIGDVMRAGASNVGAANAGQFNLPTLATGNVGLGGQRGAYSQTGAVNMNYNPSIYGVGTIPSTVIENANKQQQSYISQYGTLANSQSNSGRSVNDLIGMMSGLPK